MNVFLRIGIIIIANCLALNCLDVVAAPAIPNTDAGRSLGLWLQLVNEGDATAVAQYDATYHRHLTFDTVEKMRAISGGYRLERIEENEPDRIAVVLREKDTADAVRHVFTADPTDPTTSSETNGEHLIGDRLTVPGAVAATFQYAEGLARKDFFSGGIAIIKDGKLLAKKSWGLADRASGRRVTADTQFRVASMSKMFTSIATLQLARQGKLDLDSNLGTYLPDYPNKQIAAQVTARMLLSHTGGTGEIFGPQFAANRLQLRSNADYVKLYGARGPEFSPGSRDGYSNYGYVLLGQIIEKVSGEPFDEYLQQHIFAPARMTETGMRPESDHLPNRAAGYMRRGGRWVSNADTLPFRGTGAGGAYTTLGDMLKFANALQLGKLLPLELLTKATSSQNHAGDYGFGFMLGGKDEFRWYGYAAAAPGSDGEFRIYPALKEVVVVFSNLDPPFATAVAEYYDRHMPAIPSSP